jgi:hypothetical protein
MQVPDAKHPAFTETRLQFYDQAKEFRGRCPNRCANGSISQAFPVHRSNLGKHRAVASHQGSGVSETGSKDHFA